jgi:hypothetical protein
MTLNQYPSRGTKMLALLSFMLPNRWRVGFVPPKICPIIFAQHLPDGLDLLVRMDPRVVCYESNPPASAIAPVRGQSAI